jgi:hypothetical protein
MHLSTKPRSLVLIASFSLICQIDSARSLDMFDVDDWEEEALLPELDFS